MVRIADTLDGFSSKDWERAFGAYVKANRSHWLGPPFEAVTRILREKGAYEFGVPGLGTWTTRFRLAVLPDGSIDASLRTNPELGPRMQEKVAQLEAVFLRHLSSAS